MKDRCECADHGCPHHPGRDCDQKQVHGLFRVDMDGARIWFCEPCTDDALESGVFTLGDELEDSDDDEEPEDDDSDPTEPEEGDYIVNGLTVYEAGSALSFGPYEDWDQLSRMVKLRMEQENFYPNVWLADDHGGYTLTTLD